MFPSIWVVTQNGGYSPNLWICQWGKLCFQIKKMMAFIRKIWKKDVLHSWRGYSTLFSNKPTCRSAGPIYLSLFNHLRFDLVAVHLWLAISAQSTIYLMDSRTLKSNGVPLGFRCPRSTELFILNSSAHANNCNQTNELQSPMHDILMLSRPEHHLLLEKYRTTTSVLMFQVPKNSWVIIRCPHFSHHPTKIGIWSMPWLLF